MVPGRTAWPFDNGGQDHETLVITDKSTAVRSTQTVSLSGTGQDFLMRIVFGPSPSFSIAAGQSVTYT